MISLHMFRFADTPMGAFGRLYGSHGFQCYTVERPWLDNARGVSCIPEGTYRVERARFNRGGYEALEVLDVPGRSEIMFHIANIADEVQGCIGVGSGLGWVKLRWAVVDSRLTFDRLMESLPLLDNIELHVAWTVPKDHSTRA